jgi:hypothetical protein
MAVTDDTAGMVSEAISLKEHTLPSRPNPRSPAWLNVKSKLTLDVMPRVRRSAGRGAEAP